MEEAFYYLGKVIEYLGGGVVVELTDDHNTRLNLPVGLNHEACTKTIPNAGVLLAHQPDISAVLPPVGTMVLVLGSFGGKQNSTFWADCWGRVPEGILSKVAELVKEQNGKA